MLVSDLIKALHQVPEDTRVSVCGDQGAIFFVTGGPQDVLVIETSVEAFEEAHEVTPQQGVDNYPGYAKVLIP